MEGKTEMDRGMGQIPPDKHPEILKTAHKYRIDENDPTWILVNLVVESLGGIEKITNEGTKALREASVKVTEATAAEVKRSRELAVLEIRKTEEEGKASLNQALNQMMSSAVENAVNQIVQSTHSVALKTQARKWALIGAMTSAVVVAGLIGTTGWYAWGGGKVAGYASGLVIGGNFRHFMECDRKGWKIETKNGETWCYPFSTPEGTYGWRVR